MKISRSSYFNILINLNAQVNDELVDAEFCGYEIFVEIAVLNIWAEQL